MAYSDFKLAQVIQDFGLTVHEGSRIFADFPEEKCSDLLSTILKEDVDLAVAINTELVQYYLKLGVNLITKLVYFQE